MSNTRDRILVIARALYAQEGHARLSMRRIAAGAGISATAIYRHFDGKEALLTALCVEAAEAFEQSLTRGLEGADALACYRLTCQGYLDFALTQPSAYRVLFMQPYPEFLQLQHRAQESFSPSFQFLVDRVADCQRAGVFREGPTDEIALCIWSQVHGLCTLYLNDCLRGAQEDSFRALFVSALTRLEDGLRS